MELSEKVLFLIFEIRIRYCLNFNKANLYIVYTFDLVKEEYLCSDNNNSEDQSCECFLFVVETEIHLKIS